MVSINKIPRSTTRNSSRSNAVTHSPPVSVAPSTDTSHVFSMANLTDITQSPLYMNNSDNPGLQLISIQLDGSNYDAWSAAMKIALDAKNKIRFIDGTPTRPKESHFSFRIWSRCNSMVKSWLLNSVSNQIYRSILRLNDAPNICCDLQGLFHMINLPRTFNLTQQVHDLHQGSMYLSEYFNTLQTLWDNLESYDEPDQLCICGNAAKHQLKIERSKIVKFLAGLNDSYAIIRRQIIMMKVLPSLVEVYNILDQDVVRRDSLLLQLLHLRFKSLKFLHW